MARKIACQIAEEHIIDHSFTISALQCTFYRVKKHSIELLYVLLLLVITFAPAKRLGQVRGRKGLAVAALEHDEQALDLEEHLAGATLDELSRVVQATLTQRQIVDGLPEGWIHEQILHPHVHVACRSSVSNKNLMNTCLNMIKEL